MDSIKTQLLGMGFSEKKVNRALEACPDANNLEQIMEWLIAHEGELEAQADDEPVILSTTINPSQQPVKGQQTKDGPEASETKDTKTTIDKDKAIKLISERQLKRADEERKRDIEDEKRRRVDGQKVAQTRAELQDQERIRLAEEIRREKAEKEVHRLKVLEQIARDREAMKRATACGTPESKPHTAPAVSSARKNQTPSSSSKDCRIALRFSDGSNLVKVFSPVDTLAAVRTFVQESKKVNHKVSFVSPPNKVFNESNMKETLADLGLCPASRLEVKVENDWSNEEVQCLD